MPAYDSLPYRPCVGTMVLNRDGLVFVGRRTEGPEHVDLTHVWQMPQGGIDPGEDPWPAALRELAEETSIRSVEKLGEVPGWLDYDLPPEVAKQAWKGRYRGQTQKWYALRFTGDDREVDIRRKRFDIADHACASAWMARAPSCVSTRMPSRTGMRQA